MNLFPQGRGRYRGSMVIFIILAGALILRLHYLGKYTLWYDEAIAALNYPLAFNPFSSLAGLFSPEYLDKNLDYLAFYNLIFVPLWQKFFGNSDLALRFSSVIFSCLSIFFLYVLGKKVFSEKTAVLAAALLAISPYHIFYSQELRPYAAGCFFTMVLLYLFLRAAETNKAKYWIFYSAACIVTIYFQAFSLITVCAVFLFFFLGWRKDIPAVKRFLAANLAVLLVCLPVAINLYSALSFNFSHSVNPTVSEFPNWADEAISFKYLLFTLKNFSIGYNVDFYSWAGFLSTAVYFLLFLSGMVYYRKDRRLWLLFVCLSAPVMALFIASALKTCYAYRYFAAVYPVYVLIAAAGATRTKALLITALLAAVFNYAGLSNYYANSWPDKNQYAGEVAKQDIRPLVEALCENYKEGDRVLHSDKLTVFPLKFYAKNNCGSSGLLSEAGKGVVVSFYPGEGSASMLEYKGQHPYFSIFKGISYDMDFLDNPRLWLVSGADNKVAEYLESHGFLKSSFAETEDLSLRLFLKP